MTTDFNKLNILVIGDIMLDTYYIGSVDRISPEGPFPVVAVKKVTNTLGGAANVSYNISTLGGRSTLVGYVGNDRWGSYLSDMCENNGIVPKFVTTPHTTIVKSRIIGGHQGICRMDMETSFYDESLEQQLMDIVTQEIPKHNTIIISDYLKGAITPKLCQHIITTANKRGTTLMIDPKGTDWNKYRGAYFIKPNLKELCDVHGDKILNETEDIINIANKVMDEYQISNMLITRSEKGMTFISQQNKGDVKHIATKAQEVYDVSGAGDTVIATLACSMGVSNSMDDAMDLANHAAGVVVAKMGTTPIKINELRDAIHTDKETNTTTTNSEHNRNNNTTMLAENKIVNNNNIADLVASLKRDGLKVVFTNGVFDILHKGHVHYLQQAANLGDVLIVGLNTDDSVRRLKGESRPMNAEADRATVLAGLGSVGYVVMFGEDTPFELLKKVRPNVLVKGGDYDVKSIVGREFAEETTVIQFVDGYSTTSLINKIQN